MRFLFRRTVGGGILGMAALMVPAVAETRSWSFTKATFVPPASPPSKATRRPNPTQDDSLSCDTATAATKAAAAAAAAQTTPVSTALWMAKKKPGPAASKKIQVKLLQHVAGVGQAGDVVLVTPPFFHNKLRPTRSAQLISDDQVAAEQSQAAEAAEQTAAQALTLQTKWQSSPPLVVRRKAGPDGHLFGGVGAKAILDQLKESCSSGEEAEFLSRKGVKLTALLDSEGKKLRGDIKQTGSFAASLVLTQDISVKVEIEVQADA